MQNNTFSTLFVGQNLIKLTTVDSTNNYLKILVSKSEPLAEGTVIMADDQFAGRGQQNSTWIAAPGKNLTFSLLLHPLFLPINDQFKLNMVICNALKTALANFTGKNIVFKWPNDLYYNDQKLGGILIENLLAGNKYKSAIVGIGINVNQLEFSPLLAGKATSIAQILQEDVNLVQLLAEICSQIESGYLRLKSGAYADLQAQYLTGLYKYDEIAWYKQGDVVFEAKITGVTSSGQLVMEKEGKQLQFNLKEIEFITNRT
ncbi:biotin--[acetyl-CoA-carboxylase] ligase [Pedobacter sp. SAFR-022]|uniref:biotin--[acetyl-CoA-carboxylase] ligase n=1 Tax=Pedobacter sp. SAFR-022 TaxID=3436861 RepID=UPI003F7D7892